MSDAIGALQARRGIAWNVKLGDMTGRASMRLLILQLERNAFLPLIQRVGCRRHVFSGYSWVEFRPELLCVRVNQHTLGPWIHVALSIVQAELSVRKNKSQQVVDDSMMRDSVVSLTRYAKYNSLLQRSVCRRRRECWLERIRLNTRVVSYSLVRRSAYSET